MFQRKSFVKDMDPPLSGMGFPVLVLNAPCGVTEYEAFVSSIIHWKM